MKISIYSFGKLKLPGMRALMDYYLNKIENYAEVTEVELKPLEVTDKSEATRSKIQKAETELLLDKVNKTSSSKSKLILLDEKGSNLSSVSLAELVSQYQDQGTSELILVIGSSLGFGASIKTQADKLVSFGAQTYPHELARVVCAEQVFRAFTILKGHPYHNA